MIGVVLWTLFWGLLFIMFLIGWRLLSQQLMILQESIAYNIWALFFFPLMAMIAFSSCIISFTSFFQSKETEYLLANPISDGAVFAHKMRESLMFAGWATLFIALPLVVTYGIYFSSGGVFYAAAFLAFLPFVLLSASAGVILALLIAFITPKRKKLLAWGIIGLFGVGVWQFASILIKAKKTAASGDQGLWLKEVFDRVSVLRSEYLPSAWMGNIVTSSAENNWNDYFFYLIIISASALFLFHLALFLGGRTLRYGRERIVSASTAKKYNADGLLSRVIRSGLKFLDVRTREMILKDIKTFSRSPGQWTQFLIFFGLLAFYVLNLRTFNYHIRAEYWRMLVSYTNLTATGLVLASFTGRFVFPLISLEGRRIWVLGLAPIERKSVLMAKFWFSFLGSSLVSVFLILSSDLLLNLRTSVLFVHIFSMVLICFGLSGLAVGLGAIYPNYKENNPSKIISGFGGTANLVFSLAFVLVTVVAVSLPLKLSINLGMGPFSRIALIALSLTCGAGLALLIGILPLRMGIKAFEKAEF